MPWRARRTTCFASGSALAPPVVSCSSWRSSGPARTCAGSGSALQPLVNYDVFATIYRRYRPDFATWHTNHAAHYMHHYWRAMDDSGFPVPSSPEEKIKYGEAVDYGYDLCDELLGRFLRLVDDDTVVVLASSMGQQPYVHELYPEGKIAVRFKDLSKILAIVGAKRRDRRRPDHAPAI